MNQAVEDVDTVFTCTVSAKPLAAVFSNAKSKSPGIINPFFIQVDDTELITMVSVEEKPKDMTEEYRYDICFPALVENSDLDADTFVCVRTEDAAGAEGAYEALKALGDEPVELVIETTDFSAKITIGDGVLDIMLDGTTTEVPLPHPDDYEEGNEDLGIRWDPDEIGQSVVMFYSEYYPGYYVATTLNNHDDPDELFKVRRFIDKNKTPEIEGDSFMAESARRKLKKGAKEIAVPAVEGVLPKTPRPTPATKKKLVTEDQAREAMMVMDAEIAAAKQDEGADDTGNTESPDTKKKGPKRRSSEEVRIDKIKAAMELLTYEQDNDDVRVSILGHATAICENQGYVIDLSADEAEQSLGGTLEKALSATDQLRQYIQHAKATADVPRVSAETEEEFKKRVIALVLDMPTAK